MNKIHFRISVLITPSTKYSILIDLIRICLFTEQSNLFWITKLQRSLYCIRFVMLKSCCGVIHSKLMSFVWYFVANVIKESFQKHFLYLRRHSMVRFTKFTMLQFIQKFQQKMMIVLLKAWYTCLKLLPFAKRKPQVSSAEEWIGFAIFQSIVAVNTRTKRILWSIYTWATFDTKSIVIEKAARCTRIFRATRWSRPNNK